MAEAPTPLIISKLLRGDDDTPANAGMVERVFLAEFVDGFLGYAKLCGGLIDGEITNRLH